MSRLFGIRRRHTDQRSSLLEHLIPTSWFTEMPQWLLLLIAAVSFYGLIRGADWLVEGASGIALCLGMPKIIVGATIVSLGTTSPEAAVSVMAAWTGRPGLALGNAVGSIIADTGLIFGLGCLMARRIPADRFILNRQGWVQFGAAALLAIFCYAMWVAKGSEAAVERWMGYVLVAILGWYLWVSIRWGKAHQGRAQAGGAAAPVALPAVPASAPLQARPWSMLITQFVVGLVMVVAFGHVLIVCMEELALRWGVPEVVLASTLVAFGTSLPELVVGLTAVRKGHVELLVGNVIGADILNVLFVAGASASAARLPIIDSGARIPEIFFFLHLPTLLLILALFRVFIFRAVRAGEFRRWYGVPLLAMYVGYLIMNYALAR